MYEERRRWLIVVGYGGLVLTMLAVLATWLFNQEMEVLPFILVIPVGLLVSFISGIGLMYEERRRWLIVVGYGGLVLTMLAVLATWLFNQEMEVLPFILVIPVGLLLSFMSGISGLFVPGVEPRLLVVLPAPISLLAAGALTWVFVRSIRW